MVINSSTMSRMKSLLSPFCTIEIYHPWRSVSPYLPLHGAKKSRQLDISLLKMSLGTVYVYVFLSSVYHIRLCLLIQKSVKGVINYFKMKTLTLHSGCMAPSIMDMNSHPHGPISGSTYSLIGLRAYSFFF